MTKILAVLFINLLFSGFGSCTMKSTKLINDSGNEDTVRVNKSLLVLKNIPLKDYLTLKKHLSQENLLQESKFVKRSKGQLIISLMNGKSLLLQDSLVSTDNTNQKKYVYSGYFKSINSHLVKAQYYETGEYLLIDAKNGMITKLWGVPKLSNSKNIISYSGSLEYDLMPNGLQMLALNNDGKITLAWEFKPDKWEPVEANWIDTNIILLKVRIPDYLSDKKQEEVIYKKLTIK